MSEEEADIQWGTKLVSTKTKVFYSSFISEGIEYKLFDNVEVYSSENKEPHIGKVVKLWEEKDCGSRKVLIRWFLKHKDLDPNSEGDPRELFLAFGKGKGVTNENDLEVICGKCKVLCTSKDSRNRQPSRKDIERADFFFSKIYNVDLHHVTPIRRVVDKLGVDVVYNKEEWVSGIARIVERKPVQGDQRNATIVQDATANGSSLAETNDSPMGLVTAPDTQQKAGQVRNLPVSTTEGSPPKWDFTKLQDAQTPNGPFVADTNDRPKCLRTVPDTQQKPRQQPEVRKRLLNITEGSPPKRDVSKLQDAEPKGSFVVDPNDRQKFLGTASHTQRKAGQQSEMTKRPLSTVECPPLKKGKLSPPEEGSPKSGKFINAETEGIRPDNEPRKAADVFLLDQGLVRKNVASKTNKTPALANVVATTTVSVSAGMPSTPTRGTLPDFAECMESPVKEEGQQVFIIEGSPPLVPKLEKAQSLEKTMLRNSTVLKVESQSLEKTLLRDTNLLKMEPVVGASRQQHTNHLDEDVAEGVQTNIRRSKEDDIEANVLREDAAGKSSHEKEVMTPSVESEAEGHVKANPDGITQLMDTVRATMRSFPGLSKSSEGPSVKEVGSDVPKRGLSMKEAWPGVTNRWTGSDPEKVMSELTSKRKIFRELPWEESLHWGILDDKVLLFQNLDPVLTSVEVCEMLKSILQGVLDARVLPQETTYAFGQALVIFDTKLLADSALHQMELKCLVVANNKRPIIASKVKQPTSLPRFPGHLALEKFKLSWHLGAEEYKKALSTSHSSQPNTIEYDMAMEWRRLQEITQTCRAELFEKQRKEIEDVRKGGNKLEGFRL